MRLVSPDHGAVPAAMCWQAVTNQADSSERRT